MRDFWPSIDYQTKWLNKEPSDTEKCLVGTEEQDNFRNDTWTLEHLVAKVIFFPGGNIVWKSQVVSDLYKIGPVSVKLGPKWDFCSKIR